MGTPRSEAIKQSATLTESFTIRAPLTENDTLNKIDHYAALGFIMNRAIEHITEAHRTSDAVYQNMTELRHSLTSELETNVLRALVTFTHLHEELSESQMAKHELDHHKWSSIEETINGGAQSAVNTLESVYELLVRHFGVHQASHTGNASIADRIAKLGGTQSWLYRNIYLEAEQNANLFLNQLEQKADGSLAFKKGYPGLAEIPKILAGNPPLWTRDDMLIATQECIQLKDVEETSATLGCPITFSSQNIGTLWELYVKHARPITVRQNIARSALTSAGDSEASDQ